MKPAPILRIIALTAVLCGVGRAQVSAVSASCPKEGAGSFRSPASQVPAQINFINRTQQVLSVTWVGFEGNLIPYASLKPGESSTLNSYVGHIWVVRDASGSCVRAYIVTAGKSVAQVVISTALAGTAPPSPGSERYTPPSSTGTWREFVYMPEGMAISVPMPPLTDFRDTRTHFYNLHLANGGEFEMRVTYQGPPFVTPESMQTTFEQSWQAKGTSERRFIFNGSPALEFEFQSRSRHGRVRCGGA